MTAAINLDRMDRQDHELDRAQYLPVSGRRRQRRPQVSEKEDRRDQHDDNSDNPKAFKHFGDWVRKTRRARGLTQAQLGQRMGVGQSVISRIENNYWQPDENPIQPEMETVYRAASALGVADEEALYAAGYVILKMERVTDGDILLTDPFADDLPCHERNERGEDETTRRTRESIGERLRRARGAKGLSIQEVAREMNGVAYETAARWERGFTNLSAEKLRALCALYGVSSDWVLWGNEAPDWAKAASPPDTITRAEYERIQKRLEDLPDILLRALGGVHGTPKRSPGHQKGTKGADDTEPGGQSDKDIT